MNLEFEYVGCSTWVLDVDGCFKIGCDPALAPQGTKNVYRGVRTERIHGPVYTHQTFENVKLWLLTHHHFDHIDSLGLSVVEKGADIIAKSSLNMILKKRNDLKFNVMEWGDSTRLKIGDYSVLIEAVPAFHGMNAFANFIMGTVNGYRLTIQKQCDSRSVYVTSDTIFNEKVSKALHKYVPADVLIAHLGAVKSKFFGGPYTMNLAMLHKLVERVQPELVIPIHIDDYSHFESSRDEVEKHFRVPVNGERITF